MKFIRQPTTAILILTGALLTGSCATKIKPVNTPVEMPASFSESGSAVLGDQWWKSLEDPSLHALIEQALSTNFSLRAAWDRLEQADSELRAAGADLWPSLNTSVGLEHGYQRQRIETPPSSPGGEPDIQYPIDHFKSKTFGISADYEVDLWGRIRSLKNAEKLDTAATAEDLQTAAITLSANVATTWYELQEEAGQLALLNDQIATSEKTLDLLESRFRVGQSNATDVLQQRQLVESRREEHQRTLSRIRVLEVTLAVLVGDAPEKEQFKPEGKLVELAPLPVAGLPAELTDRRPDVRSAYYAVQAADQRVAAAIANRYPRLSVTASYTTTGEDWRDLFDNWIATLGGNVVAPILDGGARKAEVKRTRAVTKERFHQYGQTILDALAEVEQALVREQRQRDVVMSIEKQLDIARQVLERTRDQYLGGNEDFIRVLDAQISAQNLERELLTARRELVGYRIDLCRALAGGWTLEPPEKEEGKFEYPLPT